MTTAPQSAPRVLISDKLSDQAVSVFRERGVDVDYKPGLSKEELLACIGDYDGLAIRSATKVTADVLAKAGRLKVVGRAGIGVDNIDRPAATAKGVVVMNTPFGNATTTAEHAIAMMFALARQIPLANASTQASKWEKSRFMGQELTGKTLGLIGCGNIGSIVADRARGLKIKVICADPFLSEDRATQLGITRVELDDLVRRADVITIHVPLTDETRGLINAERLSAMKPTALLVNCARGGIVDEAALKDALDNGEIAGAALDVFATEPAKDNPLFGHERLVATPHLGAATAEAQETVALQVAEQISDYLLDGAITNALNAPSLTAEEARALAPYLQLAQQLGAFAGQLANADGADIQGIDFDFEGDVCGLNTAPLKQTMLQAILSPFMETVNSVNAEAIATERGIRIKTSGCDESDAYQTLIGVAIRTKDKTRTVKGTLFAGRHPRIVEVKGIPVEAEISPHMLYITNEDKPGFVGALGTLMGDAGCNMGTFHLGRLNPGGEAVSIIAIDDPAEPALLQQIRALPHVKTVVALSF